MGIMTKDAFGLRVVGLRIDPPNGAPAAGLVGKTTVAPKAERTVSVDGEGWRVLGMPHGRAMAIFAHDPCMGRPLQISPDIFMAILAVGGGPIFNRNLFPLQLVSVAVPAIHITPVVDAEIPRYDKSPDQQNERDNGKGHI
jgi:hypothetical protein